MRAMLGEHDLAAQTYAHALDAAAAHRQPMELDASVEVTLAGPTSLRFSHAPRQPLRPLGPIRWTLPVGAVPAVAATASGSAAADRPGGAGGDDRFVGGADGGAGGVDGAEGVLGSASEAWVRLELSKPRRLSELRVRAVGGAHATPAACVLEATSGAENSGVFVEVGAFQLPRPALPPPSTQPPLHPPSQQQPSLTHAASGEWASFPFYRPFKSKQFRLIVTAWHAPVAPSPAAANEEDAATARESGATEATESAVATGQAGAVADGGVAGVAAGGVLCELTELHLLEAVRSHTAPLSLYMHNAHTPTAGALVSPPCRRTVAGIRPTLVTVPATPTPTPCVCHDVTASDVGGRSLRWMRCSCST
jgi:hypothetical protein